MYIYILYTHLTGFNVISFMGIMTMRISCGRLHIYFINCRISYITKPQPQ